METPGLLPLVLNSLYALDKLNKPPALVKGAFEMKLCCLTGYEPLLDGCAVCGNPQPERPLLNLNEGVLHCAACRHELEDSGVSLPVDGPTLAALRHIVYGAPKRLFSFAMPTESMAVFSGVCESFLLAQLERGFRTLDFYKSITV